MSTAELYLTPEEIEEFIAETKKETQYFFGEEGQEYGVCPFISFYIYHGEDDFPRLAEDFIELYQELQTLMDEKFQWVYDKKTKQWQEATPENLGGDRLREYAKACYRTDEVDMPDGSIHYGNKNFCIRATDMESYAASACWAISAEIDSAPFMHYATVKITFRDSWYRKNHQKIWHAFIEKWIARLKPEQCYSGYEIGTTTIGFMGAYESDVMEKICAGYFYGLDVDHPWKMGFHNWEVFDEKIGALRERNEDDWINPARLGSGIRTPTWCFLLSPLWRERLGKSVQEVRDALDHPDIHITEIPYPAGKHNPNGEPALWVRLGELNLYPVDEGVPELPHIASTLIKPVRCNLLQLFTLDPWEGDPNPRFDFLNVPLWMARFDDDSEWPDKKRRHEPEATRRCKAGNPCPKDGKWWTPADNKPARAFKKGEIMPKLNSAYGATIWYREEDKK